MEIVKLTPTNDPYDEKHPYLVTAIKPAAKVESRVNIFINDKYCFSLEIPQVVDLHLKVGRRLTVKELNDCRHASEFGKLYHHALEYALTRPHSVKEVYDHLRNRRTRREILNQQAVKNREKTEEEKKRYNLNTKEFPLYTNQDIEAVINRLTEKGYLSDEKFAAFFVENRNYKKGISKKRIILDLRKKGISQDIIEKAFASSERTDSEEIKKIIAKKSKKYSSEQLISYLVRQGFDYQQSKDAVLEMDLQNSGQNLPW